MKPVPNNIKVAQEGLLVCNCYHNVLFTMSSLLESEQI